VVAVKREHETPDLWAELSRERELIGGEAVDGDRPFTADEKRLLAERLDLLQRQIIQIANPDASQTAALENAIVALKNAAE
jgi:hypothetical protein